MVNPARERAGKTPERCSFYVGSKRAERRVLQWSQCLRTGTFWIAEIRIV